MKSTISPIMLGLVITISAFALPALTSCTLSSQCVCTHGVTSDVADDTLKTDATVTPTVNASFTPPRMTGSVGPK